MRSRTTSWTEPTNGARRPIERHSVRLGFAAVLVAVAGCASGDAGEPEKLPSGGAQEVEAESTADVFTPADDPGPVAQPAPSEPADLDVSDSVLEPIEPVPETGVPGIDSADAFCRAWSEFAGSYQALTFGWAFQEPLAAATLEVVATDVLSSAVVDMGASLPSELDDERQALTVDLPTPLLRRAERARSLLVDAGASDTQVELLGDAWLAAVAETGTESETLAVVIPPDLEPVVGAAADSLLAQIPPIVEDPTLIVDVEIPLTEAYLFDNCPDRGTLAGNDRVD